jgi:hypothetical protein
MISELKAEFLTKGILIIAQLNKTKTIKKTKYCNGYFLCGKLVKIFSIINIEAEA